MKTAFAVALLALVMLFVGVGCTGENGKEGQNYIRCTYDYGRSLDSWYFSSYAVYYTNTYYLVGAGTYSWSYQLSSSTTTVWNNGTVVLTANPGEKGGPFYKKGADGATKYNTLNFGWSRATLTKPDLEIVGVSVLKNRYNSEGGFTSGQSKEVVEFDPTLPIITQIDTVDGFIAEWKYQRREVTK